MDEHALSVLEFPALLRVVAGYAGTTLGRDVVLCLRPKGAAVAITARQALYADALALIEKGMRPPAMAFDGLDDVPRRVAPEGAVLDGAELLRVRMLLLAVDVVSAFSERSECQPLRTLRELTSHLDACAPLHEALAHALDPEGRLVDEASAELRELRGTIRRLERDIQRQLEQLVRGSHADGVVQEHFVTVRNGRYVVPVRRDARGALPGVVHDVSNSGQTVFVEPAATLPLGNELMTTRAEERDECLRILARLSALVREDIAALRRNQSVLAEFDAALAIAVWADDFGCRLPRFGTALRLVQARHPLLYHQLRLQRAGAAPVPLDLEFGKGETVMVITGSNTGGKTVALKTVGLLTLAAQAGLPVPVGADSVFMIFDQVLADIGDEQSIAGSLSTFSAHIGHIARMLREVPHRRSLVLLDEIGTGTDPLEGGALACAILDELAGCNAVTLATTHLGIVKTYAHDHRRMVNAAVRFNVATLQPEYALDIGRPGASHALEIARRLGLDERVLERARTMLSTDHLRLEGVLAEMEEEQRRLATREQEMERAHTQLSTNRERLDSELRSLRRERRQLLHEAYQQAAGIVENTRRQMEERLRELDAAAAANEERKQTTARVREAVTSRRQALAASVAETAPKPEKPLPPAALEVGRRVQVARLGAQGVIRAVSADRKKVTVMVGNLPFTVAARELGEDALPVDQKPGAASVVITSPRPQGPAAHEINLIGLRVDEALPRLESFLDHALLAQLPEVRIVHGYGTGRLQEAVHAWLREQKGVRRFALGTQGEDIGGAGATRVILTD